MGPDHMDGASPGRWGVIRRWCGRGALLLAAGYLGLVLAGWMNPSTPVDYLMNLGSFPRQDDLMAPDDGVVF